MKRAWKRIADLGRRDSDSLAIGMWKSLQNQLVLVFFSFLLIANTAAILINPEDQLLRVASYIGLLVLVLVLHARNRFRVARLCLIVSFIPICFLPNWVLGIPVELPYLSVNALIVYMLEYLILSFILQGPGHKFRYVCIGFFMLLFIGDIFYVPIVFSHTERQTLDIVLSQDYMIFKTIFAVVIMMQLFTMHFVNKFVTELVSANRKLETSIQNTLEDFKNQMKP